MSYLSDRIAFGSKKAGLAVSGAILIAIGVGFLTASGWTLVADQYGAQMANFVIGAVFLGGGLLVLAFRPSKPPPPQQMSGALIAAFISGLQQGRNVNR